MMTIVNLKKLKKIFKRYIVYDLLEGKITRIIHFVTIAIRSRISPITFAFLLETGTVCNLKCPTCPTPRHLINRPIKNVDLETFKRIIDNIHKDTYFLSLFWTNEPLLNPHMPEMIRYAKSKNLYTCISTNATTLDAKTSKKLLDSKLDEIYLCLDGLTKESYEAFRTGARFETVYKNIVDFLTMKRNGHYRRPYTVLQFIVNRQNQNQIDEIKGFVREYGVDELALKSFGLPAHIPKEEREKLGNLFIPIGNAKSRYHVDSEGEVSTEAKHCSLVDNHIACLMDGRLSICCYDINGKHIYGSLLENRLTDLLTAAIEQVLIYGEQRCGFELCKECAMR